MEKASTGTSALKRWLGTTWKASPACTYSTIRSTFASNCSRVMLEVQSMASPSRRASSASGPVVLGTGCRSRSRTSAIASAALAYASSMPPSSTNALAMIETSWR